MHWYQPAAVVVAFLVASATCFVPVSRTATGNYYRSANPGADPSLATSTSTPLWAAAPNSPEDSGNPKSSRRQRISRIMSRFNTAPSPDVRLAGVGSVSKKAWGLVKKLHGPKTYILLSAVAGFKYDWCFRNPFYWFGVGFCVKWYRARYVFKIPVWDRQPNWNNVITSKEQEKDLKAYTCKKCGTTIFIAKSREFFFEGPTGFGGLGCFSCGAKGKENFVMDRDRIVEDVGEDDDYFDYERPLDFVTRAERRKLLKEAEGDEDKANQILAERTSGVTQESKPSTPEPIDTVAEDVKDSVIDDVADDSLDIDEEDAPVAGTEDPSDAKPDDVINSDLGEKKKEQVTPPAAASPPTKPAVKSTPKEAPAANDEDDILDMLDMDL